MAIKRYNSATGKWEYVGNPGSITPNGIGAVSNAGGSLVVPANASTKGIQIQATASQSANLQEWQNSSGVAQAYVDANGNFNSYNYNMAGKNFIINGGMDIWQRGVGPFSINAQTQTYTADRWNTWAEGSGTGVATVTQQPAGLNGFTYCLRITRTSSFPTSGNPRLYVGRSFESIADVTPWQGKTLVLSFYARAGAGYSGSNTFWSYFTSGGGTDTTFTGEPSSSTPYSQFTTLTTSWQKFTQVVTVPAGNTAARMFFSYVPSSSYAANDYFEITGVQLELGSTATSFTRTGGNYQGELSACQRYAQLVGYSPTSGSQPVCTAYAVTSSTVRGMFTLPVTMRTTPTLVASSGTNFYLVYINATVSYFNSLTLAGSNGINGVLWGATLTAGSTTAGLAGSMEINPTAAFASTTILLTAEL